jgi:ABC-type Fe3+-hydroxamate transport system substrate-binding protein
MDIEEIIAARPEVIVCQVPPGREHDARKYWLNVPDLPAAKAGRIHIVMDRRWTIPSTRSAKFARQLVGMIHPGTVKGNRPNE